MNALRLTYRSFSLTLAAWIVPRREISQRWHARRLRTACGGGLDVELVRRSWPHQRLRAPGVAHDDPVELACLLDRDVALDDVGDDGLGVAERRRAVAAAPGEAELDRVGGTQRHAPFDRQVVPAEQAVGAGRPGAPAGEAGRGVLRPVEQARDGPRLVGRAGDDP